MTDEILAFCWPRPRRPVLEDSDLDGPRRTAQPQPPPVRGFRQPSADDRRIRRIREAGVRTPSVAALMTTTEASLDQPEAIIDEYVRQGFSSIFLRPLSLAALRSNRPAGFVTTPTAGWSFKERGPRPHRRASTATGTVFAEEYASIVLRKMSTSVSDRLRRLPVAGGLGIAPSSSTTTAISMSPGRGLDAGGDRRLDVPPGKPSPGFLRPS